MAVLNPIPDFIPGQPLPAAQLDNVVDTVNSLSIAVDTINAEDLVQTTQLSNVSAQLNSEATALNAAEAQLTAAQATIAVQTSAIATLNSEIATIQAQILVLQTATPPPPTPNAPTGLVATAITTTTIAMSLVAPASGVAPDSYQWQFATPQGSGSWVNGPSTPGTTTTLTGLLPGTGYDIRAQSVSATAGPGGTSAPPYQTSTASVVVPPPPTVPNAPTNLAQTANTVSSISLSLVASTTGTAATSFQWAFRTPPGSGSFTNGPVSSGAGLLTTTLTGLAAGTSYGVIATGINSVGTGAASAEFTALTVAGSGTGPTAVGSLATADFTVLTGANALTIDSSNVGGQATYPHSGQVLNRTLWGVATGALCGNDAGSGGNSSTSGFTLMGRANFQAAMQKVPFAFFRFNSSSEIDSDGTGYFEACFGQGPNAVGSTTSPNFSPLARLIANAANCFPSYCQLTFGLGVNPSATWSTTDYATVCKAFVTFMHANWPSAAGTIIGWEVGNENVGDGGAGVAQGTYNNYFNAAAAAVHSLFPNDLMIGPVSTDENTGVFSSFSGACSANVGAYTYHGYGDTTLTGTGCGIDSIGSGSRPFQAAQSVRSVIAGATKPIMMGEYAMDDSPHSPQDDPWTQATGVAFASCWMLNGVNANANVQLGAIWELTQDTAYGQISPNSGPIAQGAPVPATGTLNIVPSAWFLSQAGKVLYGNRVRCTLVSSGAASLMLVAVTGGPGATNCAVGVFNYSTSATTGTLGLSHWPVNASGNGTANVHTVSAAQNNGVTAPAALTTPVVAGVTGTISFPARSTTIVYL